MDSSALAKSVEALRSSIRILESRSVSLESWLYIWVTLVVIGVVLEVGFVLWEYREGIVEFRSGIIHSPHKHKPSGLKLLIELLGACLVAIGVTGELAIDIKAGSVQTDLRAKNGDLVQLLEEVSSAALQRAADAEAHTLREIDARLALEKELKMQGPRWRILDDLRSTLVKDLTPFSGEPVVIIVCGSPNDRDEEKRRVVNTFWTLFSDKSVGWKPDLKYQEQCAGSFSMGVFVDPRSGDKTRDAAARLAEDLRVFPTSPARAIPNANLVTVVVPKDTVGLMVGLHP